MDNILVIDVNTGQILKAVNDFLPLKEDKDKGEPNIYLGSKLKQVNVGTQGAWAWALGSAKYVQESVKNLQETLKKHPTIFLLPKRAKTLSLWDTNLRSM